MPDAIHEFTLLTSATDVEELPLDAIHAACEDASPMSSSGIAYIGFARAASSRENAIAQAVRDLTMVFSAERSPCQVIAVEGPDYDPCRYPVPAASLRS